MRLKSDRLRSTMVGRPTTIRRPERKIARVDPHRTAPDVNPPLAPDASLDLREARRYLPHAGEHELAAFARRQLAARRRFTDLRRFYREHPCRMARVHLLTSSAVT